jgi:SAM-dependent methyltransferase
MSLLGRLHGQYVHSRRVRVLRDALSELIPKDARVLDVGCGDGLLARLIMDRRRDVEISGIDVLVRAKTMIPVSGFDGSQISFGDKSFDAVMFVDVLHHTEDPMVLLAEAKRVAAQAIVIKDHCLNGLFAGSTLRFMDWVANAPHGVILPYNYWPRDRWHKSFAALNVEVAVWKEDLRLYPKLANWIFGRSLHFVSRLEISPEPTASNAADAQG